MTTIRPLRQENAERQPMGSAEPCSYENSQSQNCSRLSVNCSILLDVRQTHILAEGSQKTVNRREQVPKRLTVGCSHGSYDTVGRGGNAVTGDDRTSGCQCTETAFAAIAGLRNAAGVAELLKILTTTRIRHHCDFQAAPVSLVGFGC